MIRNKQNEDHCSYTPSYGMRCYEPIYSDSKCILHIDIPDDKSSSELKNIYDLKKDRVDEKLRNEDYYFDGAILPDIDFTNRTFKKSVHFKEAIIKGDAKFSIASVNGTIVFTKAIICGDAVFNEVKAQNVYFESAEIGESLIFNKAEIGRKEALEKDARLAEGEARFVRIKVGKHAQFPGAKIRKEAGFTQAHIGRCVWFGRDAEKNPAEIDGHLLFNGATIGQEVKFSERFVDNCTNYRGRDYSTEGAIYFKGAKIAGNVNFRGANVFGDVSFSDAEIKGLTSFHLAAIKGSLDLIGTKFANLYSQEEACRKAKQISNGLGDRMQADDYFYREMVAKRRRKGRYRGRIGILAQYPFGYGVHPFWLIGAFLVIFIVFAVGYSALGGLTFESFIGKLYLSFTTMVFPGSSIFIQRFSGAETLLAIAQGFIGLIIWGLFIATLARKYGR